MTDILDTQTAEGTELFVFLGTVQASDKKPRALWISAAELDAAGPADFDKVRQAAGWYQKKSDTVRTIGGLYEIKCERDGDKCSMYFGTALYKGHSSHSLIAAFQALDVQARDMEYRAKNERKASEPVFMRDMERTLERLKGMPRRQALDVANAIAIELRNRILSGK
jgi:hypothetical protein